MGKNIVIVDNASGGINYDTRWNYVSEELNQLDCVDFSMVVKSEPIKNSTFGKLYVNGSLSHKLISILERNVDQDTIILFTDAFDTIIHQVHQYRILNNLKFKMGGFWIDSIQYSESFYRKLTAYNARNWIYTFERSLISVLDYNFIPSETQYRRFIKYAKRDTNKIVKCSLPFTSAIQDVQNSIKSEYRDGRDDLVVLNMPIDVTRNLKLLDALNNSMPDIQFINVHDLDLDEHSYRRLLGRAKVVLSLADADYNPYNIYESMIMGCIPILPDIPVYRQLVGEQYLYDPIILKYPFLNYLRNCEEIHSKIRNFVQNYLSLDVNLELQTIHDNYFNSRDLKTIICQL